MLYIPFALVQVKSRFWITSDLRKIHLPCHSICEFSIVVVSLRLLKWDHRSIDFSRLNLRQYQRKSRQEGISLCDTNTTSDNSRTLINSTCWILYYYPSQFLYWKHHYEPSTWCYLRPTIDLSIPSYVLLCPTWCSGDWQPSCMYYQFRILQTSFGI